MILQDHKNTVSFFPRYLLLTQILRMIHISIDVY